MKNMGQWIKQAQQMQTKITTLKSELASREVEVTTGGGMIRLKMNGNQEILEIKISRECVDPDDVAMLEDLIKTAVNQGVKESNDMVSSAMSKITGGLKIPGLF